ncbi:MAG: FAD-dependent thymidylate synthase [Lachnospira sp.]|nr:FAD-dependent thymidylate synthase [Lachnospira sp.]
MITINMIAATRECDNVNPVQMNEEMTVLSGKFGGTCYAADGYETIKAQPVEKALKRAESTAVRGHHSVFQHCMITMEIQCSKIIAMLLNSIGISNTSEKSARYTKMKPQTEREELLYQKWHDIFVCKINEVYPQMFTEKEADKLAYENARYMISVFCPTSMVYSVPFRNIFYILDWTASMTDNLLKLDGGFNKRLAEELKELRKELLHVVGEKENFHDNKNEYFRFMPVQATGEKDDDNKEYFGDVYTAKFLASFAQVAQEQRHRTLRVKINFSGDNPEEYGFYVPELIRETELETEWLSDMRSIGEVYPQGVLVSVTEQGLFEDFVLKSKERMCGRAQLEIMRLTEQMTEKFIENRENLSTANKKRLESVTEQTKPCARCGFTDFVCSEGCKWGKKNALIRKI